MRVATQVHKHFVWEDLMHGDYGSQHLLIQKSSMSVPEPFPLEGLPSATLQNQDMFHHGKRDKCANSWAPSVFLQWISFSSGCLCEDIAQKIWRSIEKLHNIFVTSLAVMVLRSQRDELKDLQAEVDQHQAQPQLPCQRSALPQDDHNQITEQIKCNSPAG